MNKEKIILITNYSGFYGGNKNNLEVAKVLSSKYDVCFFVPAVSGEFLTPLKVNGFKYFGFNKYIKYDKWVKKKNEGIKIKLLRILRFLPSIIYGLYLINKIKPVAVFSMSSTIPFGAILCRISKIKHIWYIQEFAEEDYDYKFLFGRKWSYNFILTNANKIIAISNVIKEKLERFSDKKLHEKIIIVPNGIPILNLNPNKEKYNVLTPFSMVIVGALHKGKGHMDILQACYELNKINFDYQLYIVGDGPEFSVLNKYKKKYLDDKVIFTGFVTDVNQYLYKAHIGLNCSRMEAFGLLTIEYLRVGLPVIAAKSGANVEIIKDGINGKLYDLGNHNQLKDYIIEYSDKSKKLKEISNRNITYFNSNFTTANFTVLMSILNSIK